VETRKLWFDGDNFFKYRSGEETIAHKEGRPEELAQEVPAGDIIEELSGDRFKVKKEAAIDRKEK
jgi:hypothetical protein